MNKNNSLNTQISNAHLFKAEQWYLQHQYYVEKNIANVESGYPPSDPYDVRNPNVWKTAHWKWFVEKYH